MEKKKPTSETHQNVEASSNESRKIIMAVPQKNKRKKNRKEREKEKKSKNRMTH